MQKTVPETGITFVDKPHNTIYLNVGGCQVTVTCSAKDNQELYDQVKDILVDSFFHSPTPTCENLPAIPLTDKTTCKLAPKDVHYE